MFSASRHRSSSSSSNMSLVLTADRLSCTRRLQRLLNLLQHHNELSFSPWRQTHTLYPYKQKMSNCSCDSTPETTERRFLLAEFKIYTVVQKTSPFLCLRQRSGPEALCFLAVCASRTTLLTYIYFHQTFSIGA